MISRVAVRRSLVFGLIHSKRSASHIVNGKAMAEKILLRLKNEVNSWKDSCKSVPHLTAVLVGNDPVSVIYIKNKIKAADAIGIKAEVKQFTSTVSEMELTETIVKLNNDPLVDGILLQVFGKYPLVERLQIMIHDGIIFNKLQTAMLPLPEQICNKIGCHIISSEKDVDGFTFKNFGKFCMGEDALMPCTSLAVREIILETGINLSGKNALICGRSRHVGLPIGLLLQSPELGFNATTIVCHRSTPIEQLVFYAKSADIIVSATGVPGLIRGYMVKRDAIVIDVGIVRCLNSETGKIQIVGDVNFKEVEKVASYITPVPGGVGPLTVAMLMRNTVNAAKFRRN